MDINELAAMKEMECARCRRLALVVRVGMYLVLETHGSDNNPCKGSQVDLQANAAALGIEVEIPDVD